VQARGPRVVGQAERIRPDTRIGTILLNRSRVGTVPHGRGTARRELSTIDLAGCGPRRGVVKKAENEANENRWLTF
jgi:hypothetical protein